MRGSRKVVGVSPLQVRVLSPPLYKYMFNIQKKDKKEPKNFKEVLKEIEVFNNKVDSLTKEIEILKKEHFNTIQKVAISRYNPFKDVGGDQSFTLALLDKNNSGLVLTSLYNRDGNRVYSKPIKNGEAEYTLSEEEKKVIEKAKNSNEQ